MTRGRGRTWGTGARRALLLHGSTSSSATWWQVGPALAAHGWTVVAPDLPGHGDGPPPREAVLPAGCAADVRGRLGDQRFDVVAGHSSGAVVALELVAREPRLTAAVVLEEPPGPGSVDWAAEAAAVREGAAAARRDPDAALTRTRTAQPRWDREDCRHAVADLARCRAEEVAAGLLRGADWLPGSLLHGLRTPALLLVAPDAPGLNRLDDATALRGEDRLRVRAAVGGAVREVVAGHCIHRDAPDAWLAAVLSCAAGSADRRTVGTGG